jgi:hypothetical protein
MNPTHVQGESEEAGASGPPPVTGAEMSSGTVVVVSGDVGVVVDVVDVVDVVVVDVVDVVVVGATALQVGELITLPSRVTPPLRTSARPWSDAPVAIEMDVNARMLPTKEAVVPSVAELPTCQNTLQACTPPERTTWLAGATISVLTLWKMKTELASPTRVTVPVSARPELAA